MFKKMLVLLSTIMLLLITGCSNCILNKEPPKNNDKSQNIKTELSIPVKIYQMSRDNLNLFLTDPRKNKKHYDSIYEINYDGQGYPVSNITLFIVKEEFAAFVNNKTRIKQFLLNNEVVAEIKNIMIFEAPHTPVTILVETIEPECLYFITVSEDSIYDEGFVYRLYSYHDYKNRYMCKNGILIVNGKEIETKSIPQIYYDYADVPLLTVLDALGAQINTTGTNINIKIKNNTFFLDTKTLSLYKNTDVDTDLMNYLVGGGPFYIYTQNSDIMVDTSTLHGVFRGMGIKASISVDAIEKTVIINLPSA